MKTDDTNGVKFIGAVEDDEYVFRFGLGDNVVLRSYKHAPVIYGYRVVSVSPSEEVEVDVDGLKYKTTIGNGSYILYDLEKHGDRWMEKLPDGTVVPAKEVGK